MSPVKLAVIGAGVIGQRHINLVCANPQTELVAICDTIPERKVLANSLNIPFYEDYKMLLAEEMPQGIIIATSTDYHAEVGMACAAKGFHLLIEKPITTTIETGRQLLEVAKRHEVAVLVGHHRRFNPRVQQAKAAVQQGVVGNLIAVSMMWVLQKPTDYYEVAWRTQPGGGPVLINLIHEIDTLRYICGEIKQVYAATSTKARGFAVEDTACITLTFENGVVGSLIASDAVPAPWSYEATTFENPDFAHTVENCVFYLGSRGALAFPKMELWHYASADQTGWQHPLTKTPLADVLSSDIDLAVDPLTAQLEHFCRVIRGEEAPVVSGKEGLQTLEATLAILESGRKNVPIQL